MLKSRMDTVEKTYDSDVQWVILMNNRNLVKDMMSLARGVKYGGACIIGGVGTDLSALIDEETVDLIIPNTFIKGKRGCQYVYPSFREWVEKIPEETTVYFVGDGQGSGEYIDVHWCCVIVGKGEKIWFDPSGKFSPNFSREKIKEVEKVFGGGFTHVDIRMQQYCDPEDLACDIFCQTHVVLFTHCYANGLLDTLKNIDYFKCQQFPMKKWVWTIRPFLPSWEETFLRPEFKDFWGYVRIRDGDRVVCAKI